MVIACLVFEETAKLLSRVAVPFYIHTSIVSSPCGLVIIAVLATLRSL